MTKARPKVPRDLNWIHSRCCEDGDCLIWNGGVCVRGFPRLTMREGKKTTTAQARRVVWELANRKKAGPLLVAVTCGNRLCLNPEHLEAVTKSEVVRRVWEQPDARARKVIAGHRRREHHTTKLDMEKARYIRASDKTSTALAGELGVSISLVSRVRLNHSWREPIASPFAGLGA